MLIDSHCHLDFPEYDGELDAVVDRALAAGVAGMVTISTKLERAAALREIARQHAGVWCSVGVHPHEAAAHVGVTASDLADLAADARVVGIGETGLDYFYEHSPREAQQELFRAHIAVARDSGLPLIVHTRDADEDTVRILEQEMARGAFTGLIHCFSTSGWLAEQALAMGLYISVAGIVTFGKADALREVVATLPLDRLLLETDAPFLAPAPNRGKRNEPAFVVHTAARIAELRGIDAAALGDATSDNFFRLFARADRAEAA